MVSGSRLIIDWNCSVPPARPCEAENMNAFGEYNLSPPRGPLCCLSTMKACPMNIRFHAPPPRISMGIGHESGFMLVPDAMFMRYIPASFMEDICANDKNGTRMPTSGNRVYIQYSCDFGKTRTTRDCAARLDSQDGEGWAAAIGRGRWRIRSREWLPQCRCGELAIGSDRVYGQ